MVGREESDNRPWRSVTLHAATTPGKTPSTAVHLFPSDPGFVRAHATCSVPHHCWQSPRRACDHVQHQLRSAHISYEDAQSFNNSSTCAC